MEKIYKQNKIEKKLDKAIETMLNHAKEFGVSQEKAIEISNTIRTIMEKIYEKWSTNN